MARAVIGVPMYNGGPYAEEAIRSLLGQTYEDYAAIFVDDGSTDGTATIAERLGGGDRRVTIVRNPTRLGMVANWRKCFELAQELHPEAEFFAWGSDHDVWEPDWLSALVGALDRNTAAVLAYPLSDRIDGEGRRVREPFVFETRGVRDASLRLRRMAKGMGAGSIVYGLYRAEAVRAAGVFRPVLGADRLLLLELGMRGEFVQVDRVLWHRRVTARVSRERQRKALFPGRAPWYTWLPPDLTHFASLFATYVVQGAATPEIGRLAGLRLTSVFGRAALVPAARRWWRRAAKRRRKKGKRVAGNRGAYPRRDGQSDAAAQRKTQT